MKNVRENLFFGSCILLGGGMLFLDFARILPSIAMILLVLIGISYWIKPVFSKTSVDFKPFFALSLCFILLVPSWFYSDNKEYLLERWQIALPYILLPLAFYKIPKLSERKHYFVYQIYFYCILFIGFVAFSYYLLNQDTVNQLYLESRVMPTILSHHPTLSLMIVFAIYIAFWLYQINWVYKYSFEKYVFLIGGIFLFIFIHVFSVRSGLLALYLLFFVELGKLIFKKKQIKTAIYAGLIFIILGGATLLLSPTVSNKITNTTQDIGNYQKKGSANNQSLASRMISYENAFRIAKESSLIWGCGLGDLEDLNLAIFKKDYPEVSKPIIPHNQFLFYLASIGIVGVLAFSLCFYFPFFYKSGLNHPFLTVHYIIISIGFQFEAPLETQIGVAYTLFFLLLPLHQKFGNTEFSIQKAG